MEKHTFLLKKLMNKLISLKEPIYDDCNAILIMLKPKEYNPLSEDVLCAPRIFNIEHYFKNDQWIMTKYNEIYQDVICKSDLDYVPPIDEIKAFLFDEIIESIDIANGEQLTKVF